MKKFEKMHNYKYSIKYESKINIYRCEMCNKFWSNKQYKWGSLKCPKCEKSFIR